MVVVRGSVEFDMGPAGGPHPYRERIGHSFAIATKEVTVDQFAAFLKANPRVIGMIDQTFSVPTYPMNAVDFRYCTFPEVSASCDPAHEALNEPADFWAQARHRRQMRIFPLHRLAT